jgi:hypothetical protein
MIAAEAGSTGSEEMSRFQGSSLGSTCFACNDALVPKSGGVAKAQATSDTAIVAAHMRILFLITLPPSIPRRYRLPYAAIIDHNRLINNSL